MKKTREEQEVRELDELFERFRQSPGSYVFVPLADACRKMRRLDEALEICENGVQRHPDYPSGHVVKGKCLFDKGERGAARETFERVLVLDENNLVALKYLGMIEADEGHLAIAQRHFRQILALDPDNKEIKTILHIVEEHRRPEETPESSPPDVMDGVDEILGGRGAEGNVVAPEDEPAVDLAADGGVVGGDGWAKLLTDELETSDELASVTLAEIFASQGYKSKAEKIYREVLRRQPESEEVRRRLCDLTSGDPEPGPVTGGAGGEDTGARVEESGEPGESPVEEEPAPPAEDLEEQTSAPQHGGPAGSAPEGAPEKRGDAMKPSPDSAGLEINEKDSLTHFKRWLTRIQK